MITFDSAQLAAMIASGVWPFGRALGLILAVALFSATPVSRVIQLALAIGLALVLAPLLPPSTDYPHPFSILGALIFVQQIVIGALMGLAVRAMFGAVELAAHLAGITAGFELAQLYDDVNAPQVPVLRQLMVWLALLIFLAIDGHLYVISLLAQSFEQLPVTGGTSAPLGIGIVKGAGLIFSYGLLLALPIVSALLLTQIAFAFVGRASLQFDTLSYALPIVMLLSLAVLAAMLPALGAGLEILLRSSLHSLAIVFAR